MDILTVNFVTILFAFALVRIAHSFLIEERETFELFSTTVHASVHMH